ncbi:unnamed protein product [Parnassius apollo]|uniref:(apollo) hypothetical protein n=1 Tax=Parnassius apollo TaxID=110799 RepID=A0A8S3XAA2_PARAO|nr:unnamed protein product [Parnassius apollo]
MGGCDGDVWVGCGDGDGFVGYVDDDGWVGCGDGDGWIAKLADRVRYILRSNIFDVAELERPRREAVPSSDENATAEDAAPQIAEQPANVNADVNTPVVVDSNDEGTVAQELELEHMRSTLEEAIVETHSTALENRPRLPRTALSKRNRAVVRALNPVLVTYLEASRDFLAPHWQYAVLKAPNFPRLDALLDILALSQLGE